MKCVSTESIKFSFQNFEKGNIFVPLRPRNIRTILHLLHFLPAAHTITGCKDELFQSSRSDPMSGGS